MKCEKAMKKTLERVVSNNKQAKKLGVVGVVVEIDGKQEIHSLGCPVGGCKFCPPLDPSVCED